MSTNIHAFPCDSRDSVEFAGMTLRDYFAAKAMQGICAHESTWGMDSQQIVKQAYAIADVMLAERGKA